jgi:DNA-binding winged helix-turn-helix (wHTH) protein/TolB-like protein
VRFAEFEIDPAAGVLTRNKVRIKLQDLPFRLLVALANRPGVVVSRDELRAELWGTETFVDAEAGLNTAIGKLREALQDSADGPRFIETIPKRGYRFIGELAIETETAQSPADSGSPALAASSRTRRRGWIWVMAGAALVLALGVYWFGLRDAPITIAVVRFHNETGQPAHDQLAGTLTDAVVVDLARNSRYAVIGNSPVLRTDRIFQDVKRIAETLRVDYVVLGQLQQGDAGLLARAHFIRAADGTHLWANKIDIADATNIEQRVTSGVKDGVATGLRRAGID